MKQILKKFSTLIILVVLVVIFSVASPNFLRVNNLLNVLRQVAVIGILTAGMTYVIISGGMDLTVGAYLGLSGVALAQLISAGVPVPAAVILTIVLMTVIGIVTGALIVGLNVSAIVITLGMMTVVRGLAYIFSGGLPVYDIPDLIVFLGQGYVAGIPVPVIIMVIIVVIAGLILKYSYFGRYVYAIGGNVEAAKLAGVSVNKITISLYGISAFLASIAGIVLTGRISSGAPASGTGTEMDVVTAVVIGGISVNGGKGSMLGAFLGAVIIGVLSNGLTIMNIGEYYQQVVKGLVLILAVIFAVILGKSTFGRRVYAIGTNRLTAYYSGIHVKKIRFIIYTVMGTFCGLCALFLVASSYGANTTTGNGFEMDAIAMAVFGGISSTGGKGNLAGGLISAFIIVCLRVGLGQRNVHAQVILLIIGVLLICAVALPNIIENIKRAVKK